MNPGDIYAVTNYPFVRCTASRYDFDGMHSFESWKPGVVFRVLGPFGEDSEGIAHGVGVMTLRVVSVHKPGRYPARVFYVRQWQNPDGEVFGKTSLKVTTLSAFKRLANGYRHPFRVSEPEEGEVAR